MRSQTGQSTVEVAALIPLAVAVAVAVAAGLSAGAAGRAATAAAQAGALAALQDGDPERAARAALSAWPRRLVGVRAHGGRVTVTVRPRLPVARLAALLTASSTADAGSGSPGRSTPTRGGDGFSGGRGADR